MKFRLPNSGPLELAVIPGISLPTGKDGFTSDAFDPQLVLAWAGLTLGEFDLSGGFVASRVSDSGDHTTVFSSTLTFGKSLNERTGFFIEYAGQFERHVGPAHLLHSGFTFQLRENVQADVHFGVGLSPTAPRSFVGAGLAYRF